MTKSKGIKGWAWQVVVGGGGVVLVGIKSKRAQATRCSGRPTNPWLVAFLSATQRFG